MRSAAFLIFLSALATLVALSCANGYAPPPLGDALQRDLSPRPSDFSGIDLPPGSCITACDCPSGADCVKGACASIGIAVLCCTEVCSSINLCRYESGHYSQCNNPDAGLFTLDGGTPETCAEYFCNDQEICKFICGSPTASCIGAGNGILGRCAP